MSVFKIQQARVAFQRVKTTSLHCCVPLCTVSSRYNKSVSFHSFPTDAALSAEWVHMIRRDDFKPTKNTRVCSRHFKSTDLYITAKGLRKLSKGAIPVYFSWNQYQLPASRPSVWERRSRVEFAELPSSDDSDSEMVTDHDYCVVPETGVRANGLADENEALRLELKEAQDLIARLQITQRFGIERLSASDSTFRFYTRFASYRHFLAFWELVEPAAVNKMVRITNAKGASDRSCSGRHSGTKLRPIDELILFLMYLAVGFPIRDLAERFGIHRSTAGRIIATWTHFLYQLLGSKRLWVPPCVVRAHLPAEFSAFADTQVILDCTEIYCQTPTSLVLQSEVYSSYKSQTTFKAMIGIAPHGAITFVSGLYAGSMSDREIFKLSGITRALKPGMAIMVDKGFLVDDLAPCKVYRPAFLRGKKQMTKQDVMKTQAIARLRVHVERCIRRVKENKLFDRVIPVSICGNIEELFNVACFLVNYQNGPLVKAWATQMQ